MNLTLSQLTRYHRALLSSQDWQVAANEIAKGNETIYNALAAASEPDKACSCDACLLHFYPPETDA